MEKIIGGMFGLGNITITNQVPPFIKENSIFLANARSGIRLLIHHLSPPQIWMPSYLCSAMLDAVKGSTSRLRFYEVDQNLCVPFLDWIDAIQTGDLVFFIDYFGFPYESELARQAKIHGAFVTADACQALLSSDISQYADFTLFSPRKFLGVPDGGILTYSGENKIENVHLQPPPTEWWLKSFQAAVLRREYDIHGCNREWFDVFQEVESSSPIGYYRMSELCSRLLTSIFNYMEIAHRRRENYRILNEFLEPIALFPVLPQNVVPLGFPIRLSRRDDLRNVLFSNQIYPPIHWALEGIVPQGYIHSHQLAKEIMTLPCDQRYDGDDMTLIAKIILKEISL